MISRPGPTCWSWRGWSGAATAHRQAGGHEQGGGVRAHDEPTPLRPGINKKGLQVSLFVQSPHLKNGRFLLSTHHMQREVKHICTHFIYLLIHPVNAITIDIFIIY